MSTVQITNQTSIARSIVMRDDTIVPINKSKYGIYQEAQVGDVVILSSQEDMVAIKIVDLETPISTGIRYSKNRLDELLNKVMNFPNAYQFLISK
jgi:hypothetical protein